MEDLEESTEKLPVLIDPVVYRVVVERLRRSEGQGARSRWLAILGAWDVMRIREADSAGMVMLHASEWCESWGLDESTWTGTASRRGWFQVLAGEELVSEVPLGYQVTALPRLSPEDQRRYRPAAGRPVPIDPVRYRIHVERLRALDAGGRRWWWAIGAWGVLRMLECNPGTRVVPLTRPELAEMWGVDPAAWAGWMDLLSAADLVSPHGDDHLKVAGLRRRRRSV